MKPTQEKKIIHDRTLIQEEDTIYFLIFLYFKQQCERISENQFALDSSPTVWKIFSLKKNLTISNDLKICFWRTNGLSTSVVDKEKEILKT